MIIFALSSNESTFLQEGGKQLNFGGKLGLDLTNLPLIMSFQYKATHSENRDVKALRRTQYITNNELILLLSSSLRK